MKNASVLTVCALTVCLHATAASQSSPSPAPVKLNLGNVTISTHDPVTMTGSLENSTNLYFVATNNDSRALTVQMTSIADIQSAKPSWMFDFFQFLGFASPTAATQQVLGAGESKTFTYFISNDLQAPNRREEARLPFRFRVVETAESGALPVTVVSESSVANTASATVTGTVTAADGTPVANAQVSVALNFRDTSRKQATTNAQGRFSIEVRSIDDVRAAFGSRALPYRSLDYFVTAEAPNHGMAYRGGIAPASGETVSVDLTLASLTPTSYSLIGSALPMVRLAIGG